MNKGEYSRLTFDPTCNYSGVLMQQGRVQLDADWNELVEIIDRRFRAQATDVMGPCVVPVETSGGFEIQRGAEDGFTIGRGRIYVHGLLAENHGILARAETADTAPISEEAKNQHDDIRQFDRVLDGVHGVDCVAYDRQPFYPNPPSLPKDKPYLVYVDVWRREVTALDDPALIEVALGVDTTTRSQTVWQVKYLAEGIGPDINRDNYRESPAWKKRIRPSGGRLTTSGTYHGADNCFYRVEIHEAGTLGKARFKWSQDLTTIMTRITKVDGARLTVERTKWDEIRRFKDRDWLEITDREHELSRGTGELVRIKHVDHNASIIELESAWPGFGAPADGSGAAGPLRIRRWDGEGQVPADGNPIALDKHGVKIAFSLKDQESNDAFRVGDYWAFATRSVNGSIDPLNQAPPRGIHHHYGCLAVVNDTGHPTDCRIKYHPHYETVTPAQADFQIWVTADSHRNNLIPIQSAIDRLRDKGGTIYLGPGVYRLAEPLWFEGARSIRLSGQGPRTILKLGTTFPTGIVVNGKSKGVIIENLALVLDQTPDKVNAVGVFLQDSSDVTVRHCHFSTADEGSEGERLTALQAGLVLAGKLERVILRDNWFEGRQGIIKFSGRVPHELRDKLGHQIARTSCSGLCLRDNVFRLHRGRLWERIWSWLWAWPEGFWREWTWRRYGRGFTKG